MSRITLSHFTENVNLFCFSLPLLSLNPFFPSTLLEESKLQKTGQCRQVGVFCRKLSGIGSVVASLVFQSLIIATLAFLGKLSEESFLHKKSQFCTAKGSDPLVPTTTITALYLQ